MHRYADIRPGKIAVAYESILDIEFVSVGYYFFVLTEYILAYI